jgi:hypothetical protein
LCSPLPRIREFEEDWKGILRGFGLDSLTMKRALRRKIPFSPNTEAKSVEERNNVLKPFVDCIRRYFTFGRAVAIDVEGYKKWPPQARKRVGGSDDPHYFAFLSGLLGPAKYISNEDRFSLVCDDDKQTAMNCYRLYGRVRTINPELKRKMVAITFADDDVFVPLQAADLLASLCRLEAGRQFHREYYEYMPTFRALTGSGSGMRWAVNFYGGDRMKDLGERLVRLKRR